jgi:hypothetical protein
MKKTVICNITMKEKTDRCVYPCKDRSLPVSDKAVVYPINAFLEKTMQADDEVTALLLMKKDPTGNYQKNAADFVEELLAANEKIGAHIEFKTIETDFAEEQSVHEALLGRIVDELEDGTHVLADITYGPKDLPIVLFAALNFAENFLGCEVDNLIYGQVNFQNGVPTNPQICDMVPLYYLNSVTNTIRAEEPDRARQMLKSLLSI